jgi:hypothetical protein
MSTTALAVRPQNQVIQFNNARDIVDVGIALGKAAMFGCTKAEDGIVIAWTCASEGITPIDFIRTYHLIGGKPSKKALACLAEFNEKGGKHKWKKTGDDGIAAECEFTFEGQTITVTFTMEDAKRQQLVKPNSAWTKTPGNMLRCRVITNAIGMLVPSIVAGLVPGDDDDTAPTQAPLLPEKQATTVATGNPPTTPKQEPPAPVVEVEVVQDTPKPEATEKPAETPEPFKAEVVDGRLTGATQAKIIELVGEDNMSAALTWLIAKGKIPKEGNLSMLRLPVAQSIIDKTKDFKAAVGIKG